MENTVENKRVKDMTDREYRAYKRMLRRQREQRRRLVISVFSVLAVVALIIAIRPFPTSAKETETKTLLKYYTGVTVKSGDTLWSISDDYIDYSVYRNKASYMKEVCSINHLEDASDITVGQRIIVPYFSEEYVQ